MTIDLTRLSPGDAAAAIRSYPRRYRAALVSIEGDDAADELAHRIGPEGRSALDLAVDTARTWMLIARALHDVLVQDTPALHPATLEPGQRHWEGPEVSTVGAALDLIEGEASGLAETIDRTYSASWTRPATLAGTGRTVEAFDLVREAVRTGHDNLRGVEQAMDAARR